MWLVEAIPKMDKSHEGESVGADALTQRAIAIEVSDRLKQAWIPPHFLRSGVYVNTAGTAQVCFLSFSLSFIALNSFLFPFFRFLSSLLLFFFFFFLLLFFFCEKGKDQQQNASWHYRGRRAFHNFATVTITAPAGTGDIKVKISKGLIFFFFFSRLPLSLLFSPFFSLLFFFFLLLLLSFSLPLLLFFFFSFLVFSLLFHFFSFLPFPDEKRYLDTQLPFVSSQPSSRAEVAPSLLSLHSTELVSSAEWEQEWNKNGLGSGLSQDEYRARKKQRLASKFAEQMKARSFFCVAIF